MDKPTKIIEVNPLKGLNALMPQSYHNAIENTNDNAVGVSRYLSRPLYFPAIHRNESAYKVAVYADVVQTKAIHTSSGYKLDKANKNTLHGFSNGSRHAMIEFLAKVEQVPDLFVTLTYSDDVAEQWYLNMRRDFEAFRKRLERAYPDVCAMWRIEFVPRKSGRLMHRLIPHFHMLVWLPVNTTQERKALILNGDGQLWRNAWHEITHSHDPNHLAAFGCKVETIKSRKHAYAYCSKYLAKENEENVPAGRRWGRIGKFEHPTEIETQLTSREYVHFKRLLNAYIKADALKRYRTQKLNIPYPQKSAQSYLKFYDHFVRMSVKTGSSVFGLGFISQENPEGLRTVIRMLRHARELAALDHAATIESRRSD